MPRQPLDPNYEYPLAYRLAQFLLDASGQTNQYEQGLRQQSAGAADILESEDRRAISRDELARRKRADAEAAGEADLKARRRTASSNLIKALGRGADPTTAINSIEPGDLDPEAYKFALAHLTKPRDQRPQTVSPGVGVLNESGGYDVPIPLAEKPERPPATVAPGHGVRNPAGGYDVPVPITEKPEKPEPPSSERTLRTAAIAEIRREGGDTTDEELIATRMERNRKTNKIEVASSVGQNAAVAPLLGAEGLGVKGAKPGETVLGMKNRLESEVPKPEGVEERQSRVYGESVHDIAKSATTMLSKPEYTQYMGTHLGVTASQRLAARRFAGKQGPGVPNELIELDSTLSAIHNRVQRALFSARASDQDAERTLREVPRIDDLPNEAQIKLQNTLRNLTFWEQRAAEATGRVAPTAPGATRKPDFRYNPATRQLEPVP